MGGVSGLSRINEFKNEVMKDFKDHLNEYNLDDEGVDNDDAQVNIVDDDDFYGNVVNV